MNRAEVCLQLDVGNSSAKWRLLQGDVVVARGRYVPGDRESEAALLGCRPRPQQIWIASVAAADAEQELQQLLFGCWQVRPWFARSQAQTGDLRSSYQDPSRMGVDRWLVMLAGRRRQQSRLCVVDAGSALTIDLVAADGCHEGGYIIPGPTLMERALLMDTDRVRFAEAGDYELSPGNSTATAVRHGIAVAQVGALRTVLSREGLDASQVLFCGGGGAALMQMSGCPGTLAPDLVFEGLEVMAGLEL